MNDVRTYRGRSLEEILPRIREELGPDAVITRQRDGLTGGVAGFFQKRCIEIEARSGEDAVDLTDEALASTPQLDELLGGYTRGARFQRLLDEAETAPPEAMPESEPEAALEREPEPFAPMTPEELTAFAPPVPPQPASAAVAPYEPDVEEARKLVEQAQGILDQARQIAAAPMAPAPLPAPAGTAAHPLVARLTERGLDPRVAEGVVADALTHVAPFAPGGAEEDWVRIALERRIPVQAAWGGATRAVAFAGGPGAGRTTCAARLSLAYAAAGVPVACVALRPADHGAALHAQLAGSAVTPIVAHRPEDVPADARRGVLIVDTPAVGPYDPEGAGRLAADLAALGVAEVHLTLPATLGPLPAREAITAASALSPAAIALTHVDSTKQWGPGVSAAIEHALPLSYLSHHPGAEAGLRPVDPAGLARTLL